MMSSLLKNMQKIVNINSKFNKTGKPKRFCTTTNIQSNRKPKIKFEYTIFAL